MDGTRASVLREATGWLKDPDQHKILWVYGAPGAGKSALATSLVDEFRKVQLCARVFAKRDFAERRDPGCIWQTLAYDLARLHVGLKGSIMEALYVGHYSPGDQLPFRNLVIDVLHQQQYLSVVAVIDALDECFTDDSEQWSAFLQTFAGWSDLPRSFKLVVTSRDIPDIRNTLEKVSHPICLTTGNEASVEVRHDVQTFLRRKLASKQLSEETFEELTAHAAGSFIWAKMIVDLVEKSGSVAAITGILNGSDGAGDIDVLYGHLLSDTLGQLDGKRRDAARSFLAILVLVKDPLRKSDLVDLADSNQSSVDERRRWVDSMVEDLSSVISVGDNEVLRIPHKSFSDFLLDDDRSFAAMKRVLTLGQDADARSYLVDVEGDSAKLCISCLRVMNKSLKFNACGIKTSNTINDTLMAEAGGMVSENISSSLIYACRYWAEHLKKCDRNDAHFRALAEPHLKTLLCNNFLFWLEILSLAKAVPSAATSLEIASDFLEVCRVIEEECRTNVIVKGQDLAEVAKYGILFVKIFEEPITTAAPHIYLSALPFCPSTSRIAQIYGPQYPNVLSVVNGGDDSSNKTFTSDVAFFPDGGKLACGSEDGSVRIWDIKSGHALSAPFTGHNNEVWSVAVSRDGSQIASGDRDGGLRIWDSDTGACPLGTVKAHSLVICSVAFSPDGSRIVTGSDDATVKVWTVATGDLCLGPLTGHTRVVMSVSFSPDGNLIASGSRDNTIRIWDARTGESRRKVTGHTDWVNCVAFSADGHYLASGSDDKTICLWDVAQGFSQLYTVHAGNAVWSLSFSPSGGCLVSGSYDGVLRFWNVDSMEEIGVPIHGHSCNTGYGVSVVFAPDGLSVASCSFQGSIKLWTVPTISALNLPPGTLFYSNSL